MRKAFFKIIADSKFTGIASVAVLFALSVGVTAVVHGTHIIEFGARLAEQIAVITLCVYLFTRTQCYKNALRGKTGWFDKIFIVVLFGALSIYGTVRGIPFEKAFVNVRDVGPVIAGLVGGPVLGFFAGFLGAVHRWFQGGPTAWPCAIATVCAGVFGGLFLRAFKRRASYFLYALLGIFIETFHLTLTYILYNGSAADAWALVKIIYFPMAFATTMGLLFLVAIRKLQDIELDKEKTENELQVAKKIQMGMIPKIFPAFPHRAEFDIYAVIEPAKVVGGDLYDFFFVDDHKFCFIIGDVSGKGVPAALYMAVTKTLLKAAAIKSGSPEKLLTETNDDLSKDNDECMFATVFCGILDTRTGEVLFSNAGHNPPLIMRADGTVTYLEQKKGLALGVMEGTRFYLEKLKLERGDSLFVYTDGVTEAFNEEGQEFSEERLQKELKLLAGKPAKHTVETIKSVVVGFAGEAPQADDITIMQFIYYGAENPPSKSEQ
jgi:sigma-B regulation protein RsbU (phosphoserine phosphatase)